MFDIGSFANNALLPIKPSRIFLAFAGGENPALQFKSIFKRTVRGIKVCVRIRSDIHPNTGRTLWAFCSSRGKIVEKDI